MQRNSFALTLSLLFLLVSACAVSFPRTARANDENIEVNELERNFKKATVLLYAQTENGGLEMMCTATAFEKEGKLYRFVTAAHCVAEDDTNHQRVEVKKTTWFITQDDETEKTFLPVKIVGVGYQHRGDDYAVLERELSKDIPTIPLAANDPALGENVSNFASPLGLGKQLFRGHVSMAVLDRPVIFESINWKGATLLQMSVGPGSSGSAVVSQRQKGIVAFIVGEIGNRGSPNIVAISANRFRTFWKDVRGKKYKWFNPDTDTPTENDSKTSVKKLWRKIHEDGFTYHIGDTAEMTREQK